MFILVSLAILIKRNAAQTLQCSLVTNGLQRSAFAAAFLVIKWRSALTTNPLDAFGKNRLERIHGRTKCFVIAQLSGVIITNH